MNKYIAVAFALMGVGFYELSGGADFEPGQNSFKVFAEPRPVLAEPEIQPAVVARADTNVASLTEIAPARALIEPVAAALDVAPDEAVIDAEPGPVRDIAVASPAVAPDALDQPDLRFVDADRVNMRGGPGTDYAVVGRLLRNDMIEVLKDEGNGWLHLRDTASGDEGWVADWLVTAAN